MSVIDRIQQIHMEAPTVVNKPEEALDLPPGFRFHPTDEEIITCYLTEKVLNCSFSAIAVGEADLNKCEPWDLPSRFFLLLKFSFFFFVNSMMKNSLSVYSNHMELIMQRKPRWGRKNGTSSAKKTGSIRRERGPIEQPNPGTGRQLEKIRRFTKGKEILLA